MTEIRRLVSQIQQGDRKALYKLAEWGLDAVVSQMLDAGEPLPLWARVRLMRQLQERHNGKTGRGDGAARRNKEQSRIFREKVAQAAALVSLHDLPDHKRVGAVRQVFMDFGAKHFGLCAIPDDQSIRAVISDLLNE